jgi:hypothetical protein
MRSDKPPWLWYQGTIAGATASISSGVVTNARKNVTSFAFGAPVGTGVPWFVGDWEDHIGDARLDQDPNSAIAACDRSFPRVPAVPDSNLAEITARKNAAFIGTPPVAAFLGVKMANIRGGSV